MNRVQPLRADRDIWLRCGFLVAIAASVAACGHGSAPPEGSAILSSSKGLADQMCACKDKACGTPLRPQWDALTKEISGASFTTEQVDALAQQDQRFFKCMAALDGAR
jgi:hypothetical protein